MTTTLLRNFTLALNSITFFQSLHDQHSNSNLTVAVYRSDFKCLGVSFKLTPEAGVSTNDALAKSISRPTCCSPNETEYFSSIDAMPTFVDNLPMRMPIQLRGPSPNGKYGISLNVFPLLFSLLKRDGSNFSGFGKYFSSRCNEYAGINTEVPFCSVMSVPGIL